MSVTDDLPVLLEEGRISRREFVKYSAYLGMSATVAGGLLRELNGAAARASIGASLKEVTIGVASAPGGIDPVSWTGFTSNWVELALFEPLFQLTGNGTQIRPWLAAKMQKQVNPTTWEYQLRSGVKFHNGDELTADDIAYNIVRANKIGYASYVLGYLKDAKAVDKQTLRITLTKPDSRFQWWFYGWSPSLVLPKKYLEKVGTDGFKQHPVGTGPYRFVSNSPASVVVERNPDYWRKGWPKFDKLTFKVLDPTTLVAALRSGDIQFSPDVGLDSMRLLQGQSNITVQSNLGSHMVMTHVNALKKPLDDVRVRRAMAEALDNTAAFAQFPPQFVKPSHGAWIHPAIPGSAAAVTDKVYTGDLTKAKKLLQASSAPRGFSLTCMIPSTRPVEVAAAIGMQSRLKQIGINVQLKKLTDADTAAATYARPRPYDLITYNWAINEPTPLDVLVALGYSKNAGATNFSGYNNPQYDRLVNEAITSSSASARASAIRQLQIIATHDAFELFHGWDATPTWSYRNDMIKAPKMDLEPDWDPVYQTMQPA